jgi:hypothetical protein
MVKKTTKRNDGIVIKIDQATADALGITEKTPLKLYVVDGTLIVKPRKRAMSKAAQEKKNERTKRLMDKYDSVLKKLAKS